MPQKTGCFFSRTPRAGLRTPFGVPSRDKYISLRPPAAKVEVKSGRARDNVTNAAPVGFADSAVRHVRGAMYR